MSIIALDYDETYTADKGLWDNFIEDCKNRGHEIYIVTARHGYNYQELLDDGLFSKTDGVYFTGHRAKRSFMYEQGIDVNIWIDDNPNAILFPKEE